MKIGTSNTKARYFNPIHLLVQFCHFPGTRTHMKITLVSGTFLKDDTQPVTNN